MQIEISGNNYNVYFWVKFDYICIHFGDTIFPINKKGIYIIYNGKPNKLSRLGFCDENIIYIGRAYQCIGDRLKTHGTGRDRTICGGPLRDDTPQHWCEYYKEEREKNFEICNWYIAAVDMNEASDDEIKKAKKSLLECYRLNNGRLPRCNQML